MSEQTQVQQKFLTVTEAARVASVNRYTIYRWIYSGILPAYKSMTGIYRILPEDLDAVLYAEPANHAAQPSVK